MRGGQGPIIKRLLEKGADANARFRDGSEWTGAIIAAAESGDLVNLDLIVDQISGLETIGETALQHAADYGHYQIVLRLLDLGADPNGNHKSYHKTPLYAAAKYRHI